MHPTVRAQRWLWTSSLCAALALVAALAASSATHAEDGALGVDCEGNSPSVDATCRFGEQQVFTVLVRITAAPEGGYAGFQGQLRWDPAVVDYRPAATTAQEVAWSDCSLPVRSDAQAATGSLFFGCVSFPVTISTYVGPVFLLTFACGAAGTSTLNLVSPTEDPSGGSFFVSSSEQQLDPALAGATITCQGVEATRPPPEVTASVVTPLAELTETPPGEPGAATTPPSDSNATAPAGAAGLPNPAGPESSGTSGGGGLGTGAWLLIGLALTAGAGALGYLASRRRRSSP